MTDMLDLARPTPQGAQTSEGPAAVVDLSRLVEGEALTFEAVAFERDLTWQCTVARALPYGATPRASNGPWPCFWTTPASTPTPGAPWRDAAGCDGRCRPFRAQQRRAHRCGRPAPPVRPLYRADKARTHNAVDSENDGAGGYGLGLAIARDTPASPQRAPSPSPAPHKEGTTFTLRLPLV